MNNMEKSVTQNIECVFCKKSVEIENQTESNGWIGILANCNHLLAICPCGEVVEDSRLNHKYSMIAYCPKCDKKTYQEDEGEYQEWLKHKESFVTPSNETKDSWLFAENQNDKIIYPKSTENSGKWLVFVQRNEADEIWNSIKLSIENGELGNAAKISSSSPQSIAFNPRNHVICVYTHDWTDKEDVLRIRQKLRTLGITWKIPYKADEDTLRLKYSRNSKERISKYYD